MPHIAVGGTDLYYEESGGGPETIVFAHGCLLNCRMFDVLIPALEPRYRCLRFDFRGQGRSAVTRSGYDMDGLAAETAELIGLLSCAPCHFLGFSMGGFVGMRLAVEHSALLRSLILIGTSASREPNALGYRILCGVARLFGARAVAGRLMPLQFGRDFLRDPLKEEIRRVWYERMARNSRLGSIRAAGGVIRRPDYSNRLSEIRVPTLIVAGAGDRALPPEESRKLHGAIAGSQLVLIPGAGHAVPIEDPVAVHAALEGFLKGSEGI